MTEKKSAQTAATVLDTKTNGCSRTQLKDTIDSARNQAFSLASDLDSADVQLSDFIYMLCAIHCDMDCDLAQIERSDGEAERLAIRSFVCSCKHTVVVLRAIEYAMRAFLREYKCHTERAYNIAGTLRELLEAMEN